MRIYFAADHAGYELKNELLAYVRDELGYEVEDCGAHEVNHDDDYPEFVKCAAEKVSESPEERKAIVLGASGQGEAMVANRHRGVRAAVYYGEVSQKQIDMDGNPLSIVASTRMHNDANVLSLGARFLGTQEAKDAVKTWLQTGFLSVDRHVRRIKMLD